MRNHALFVQDQWTLGKLTVLGALRYDHASSWAPEQRLESRFWNAPLSWDRTPVVDAYNDITPRFSAAYDLFGNGKTAIKATLGKYLESTITASNYALGNPTSRIATNVTRTWTDANAQLGARLRLPQPADSGQHRGGGGRTSAAWLGNLQLRDVELQQHDRPGHPARAGACARRTGTGACRCSRKCCRACRWRSASSTASSSASR